MNEGIQIIRKDGEPEYAVVPYREFERLREAAEMTEDVVAFRASKAEMDADGETIPGPVLHRLLDGEHPIKVWREHRELKQAELAERVGVSSAYLSQIEGRKREGKVGLYHSISNALEVSLDLLIGWQEEGEAPESDGFPAEAVLCEKCAVVAVVEMDGCLTCFSCGDSRLAAQ